ncbi:MAG: repressor LexA [Candidatus Liptonbacteria bacterium]|nr:repressor LexA [Candidatus Liptonbacteria bacterium]
MPQKEILTPSQRRVYEFIKLRISKSGRSPTLSEIAKEIGAGSIRSVTQYLEALERKGLIRRNRYVQRGIELIKKDGDKEEFVSLPVFASAGCGSPSVIAERTFDEYITVSSNLVDGERDNLFVIKASGESMVDAWISDGSFVLVEMTEDVEQGDLVVAIIDDNAVIKKISFANNAVILNPVSNDPIYQPIILRRDFKVFGRVIEVIRVEKNEEYQIIYE